MRASVPQRMHLSMAGRRRALAGPLLPVPASKVVEAVFVPMNTPVDHVEGDMAQARELARALSVPLLAFDYKELASGRGPFAVV